jgi:hypothetical protein
MASQLIADISASGPTIHTTHSSAVNQPSPGEHLSLISALAGECETTIEKIMAYHRYSSDVKP